MDLGQCLSCRRSAVKAFALLKWNDGRCCRRWESLELPLKLVHGAKLPRRNGCAELTPLGFHNAPFSDSDRA